MNFLSRRNRMCLNCLKERYYTGYQKKKKRSKQDCKM